MSLPVLLRSVIGASVALAPCAVRNEGLIDPGKSTSAVVLAVESLQQAAQVSDGGYSPQLKNAIKALLSQLAVMSNSVSAHHAYIQSSLNTGLETVQNTTNLVVDEKAIAVPADQKWVSCVSKEKDALVKVEDAQALIDQTTPVKIDDCNRAKLAGTFSFNISATTFTCDQRMQACSDELGIWSTDMDLSVVDVSNSIATSVTHWKNEVHACTTSTELLRSQVESHKDLDIQWEEQRAKCHDDNANRIVDMCVYGVRLQEKCAAEEAYIELMKQVRGTNNTYSLSDLNDEWNVIQQVHCMLTGLETNGTVLSTADCQSGAATLASAVGTMEMHETAFAGLVSDPKAKCQSDVTFSDSKWDFKPSGSSSEVKSGTYVFTEPWSYAFSRSGLKPFPLC